MKKFLCSLICLALILPCLMMVSCKKTKAEATRMTLDLNPSVEFMLDKDNKVVSATALNDDGSIILHGEAFIGKTAEEAAELFVSIADETGYLVKGSVSAGENEIKISVSGDDKFAENLYDDCKSKINSYLADNNINATLSQIDALKRVELVNLIKKTNPELSDAEISEKSDEELYKMLIESRKEIAKLLSVSLQDAYYQVKSYEISLVENQKVQEIIQVASVSYEVAVTQYNNAMTTLTNAIAQVEAKRQELLVDSNSDYQKALVAYLEAKQEVMVLKEKIDNGSASLLDTTLYNTKAPLLPTLKLALNTAYNGINTGISMLITALQSTQTALETVKASLPEDIKLIIKNNTQEIEIAVNNAKTNLFNQFEVDYQTAISEYNTRIANMKHALKS